MELKIKTIKMENFKRNQYFYFDFGGADWAIFGDNETGKTTIFDALTWLLFGKDSLGRADFNIKPIDPKTEEVIHNLETVVEILFDLDGKDLLIKRLYRETWKGLRGGNPELSGHETLVYVNEEKVGVMEYNRYIDSLVKEDIFRILTDVYRFNNLPAVEQRTILFGLVRDITDDDILEADKSFKPLKQYLPEGRSVESLVKILKDRNGKLKEQINEYPAKITTLANLTYDLPDDYNDELNKQALQEAYAKRAKLEEAKASGSNQSKINELAQAIVEFEREIERLRSEREKLSRDAEYEKINNLRAKNTEIENIKSDIKVCEIEINNNEIRKKNGLRAIEEEKAKLPEIYQAYKIERDKVFTAENCSYCGQALPPDMVEELEKQFNMEKGTKLTRLQKNGEAIKACTETYTEAVAEFDKKIAEFVQKKAQKELTLAEKVKEYQILYDAPTDVDDSKIVEKIETANQRKGVICITLDKVKKKDQPTLFDADLENVKNEIERLIEYRTTHARKLENIYRISDLEAEEKDAKEKHEENLMLLTLCEKFIVAKRAAYQTHLDGYFQMAKFKLFEENISGGVRETCVATYEGVYYPSLNNGAKVNIGLDVIWTLQYIYGVKVPIFIDNAESTTSYLPMDSQVIWLYVSKSDKELRFEKIGEPILTRKETEAQKEREGI